SSEGTCAPGCCGGLVCVRPFWGLPIEPTIIPDGGSIEELGVPVHDLGGRTGAVLLHDLAAGPGEPALESPLEAGAVQEPEDALALGLSPAHVALVLHARGVEVGPL